jgi:DNA-binding NarL/FixJ family response regulator
MRARFARVDLVSLGLAALTGVALFIIQEGPLVAGAAALSVLLVGLVAEPLARRIQGENPPQVGGLYAPLTHRESEVAVLVAESLSNKEIAGRLFITERGVESHVKNIMDELSKASHQEFHSRTQIALWVKERQRQAKPVTPQRK